ncbi:hypothetical protein ERJ75_000060100 [Trypanosoma vivax]|nr:hypothetical protein ERJ75_000060100 [Trypanosoma vivax]
MGFSDGLDARVRQCGKFSTAVWAIVVVSSLAVQVSPCSFGLLPHHIAPVWLGISALSALKSALVNHTAPLRALFGIREYPPTHGMYGGICTAEAHEYRLAFTGVDVEERRDMWQSQKKALDYECNVRLYRMLRRIGLFDRIEEAEYEAKNLQRKLAVARSRRRDRELPEKQGAASADRAPEGLSAEAAAEAQFDEIRAQENERRQRRRATGG